MGYQLAAGDHVVIVEDVITAGTAVKEVLPLLRVSEVVIDGMVVSVDRMERGADERSAIQAMREDNGIRVSPIVTVTEIIEILHNQPVDGVVVLNDSRRELMEEYLKKYGTR